MTEPAPPPLPRHRCAARPGGGLRKPRVGSWLVLSEDVGQLGEPAGRRWRWCDWLKPVGAKATGSVRLPQHAGVEPAGLSEKRVHPELRRHATTGPLEVLAVLAKLVVHFEPFFLASRSASASLCSSPRGFSRVFWQPGHMLRRVLDGPCRRSMNPAGSRNSLQ